jgi:hypothetical protein
VFKINDKQMHQIADQNIVIKHHIIQEKSINDFIMIHCI